MLEKTVLKWTQIIPTNDKDQALHPGEVAARKIPEIPFADCGRGHKHAMIPHEIRPDGLPVGPFTFPEECTHCNPPATPEQLTAHAIHSHREDSRGRHDAVRDGLDKAHAALVEGFNDACRETRALADEVRELRSQFGKFEAFLRSLGAGPSNAPSTIPPKPRQDG